MEKKKKTPLILRDDYPVRTLEELQKHFDLKRIKRYYKNGQLAQWLQKRSYETLYSKITVLNANGHDLDTALYSIFDIRTEPVLRAQYSETNYRAEDRSSDKIREHMKRSLLGAVAIGIFLAFAVSILGLDSFIFKNRTTAAIDSSLEILLADNSSAEITIEESSPEILPSQKDIISPTENMLPSTEYASTHPASVIASDSIKAQLNAARQLSKRIETAVLQASVPKTILPETGNLEASISSTKIPKKPVLRNVIPDIITESMIGKQYDLGTLDSVLLLTIDNMFFTTNLNAIGLSETIQSDYTALIIEYTVTTPSMVDASVCQINIMTQDYRWHYNSDWLRDLLLAQKGYDSYYRVTDDTRTRNTSFIRAFLLRNEEVYDDNILTLNLYTDKSLKFLAGSVNVVPEISDLGADSPELVTESMVGRQYDISSSYANALLTIDDIYYITDPGLLGASLPENYTILVIEHTLTSPSIDPYNSNIKTSGYHWYYNDDRLRDLLIEQKNYDSYYHRVDDNTANCVRVFVLPNEEIFDENILTLNFYSDPYAPIELKFSAGAVNVIS